MFADKFHISFKIFKKLFLTRFIVKMIIISLIYSWLKARFCFNRLLKGNIAKFFLLCLFFICFTSTCGFLDMAGSGVKFGTLSSVDNSGPGETPTLRPRLQANPGLKSEPCDEHERCKETCRDIYRELLTQKQCYKLTIGDVADLEDVFYTILRGNKSELADIDTEALENYIKLDLTGFSEKLIDRINDTELSLRRRKLQAILNWIVDEEKTVVPVLKLEDQKNEILSALFKSYCNQGSGPSTQDTNLFTVKGCLQELKSHASHNAPRSPRPHIHTRPLTAPDLHTHTYIMGGTIPEHGCRMKIHHTGTTNYEISISYQAEGNDYTSSVDGDEIVVESLLAFDSFDSSDNLYYCSLEQKQRCNGNCPTLPSGIGKMPHPVTNNGEEIIVTKSSLTTVEDKDLFIALSAGAGAFFNYAMKRKKQEAFLLGYSLLEDACSTDECKQAFLCQALVTLNDNNKRYYAQGTDIKVTTFGRISTNITSSTADFLNNLEESISLPSCNYATW